MTGILQQYLPLVVFIGVAGLIGLALLIAPFLLAFQQPDPGGVELLPYWLLGAAGELGWDDASTPQKRAADAHRAPKLPGHPDYVGPLNYAYHFDAVAFADLLREHSIAAGVAHIVDTVRAVRLGEDGAIAELALEQHGTITADLYVDCTGFRAELIGKALAQPWKSARDTLFCDTAVALQAPYPAPDDPIASYTISTGRDAGWIWDIGLAARRGIGYVYSSSHSSAEEAERVLRAYVGPAQTDLETRTICFSAGYREVGWHKNCVAVGLSSGFFEPLEATGIVFSEIAASLIANLFPWAGDFDTSSRQFNANMRRRYERTLDFLKMHFCLTKRTDTAFWIENAERASIPDSLSELLDRWRFRPPNELDIDGNIDIFPEASWQYVLYGMGWKTDLSAKAPVFRYPAEAREAFARVQAFADHAVRQLPSNRDLVRFAQRARFGQETAAA